MGPSESDSLAEVEAGGAEVEEWLVSPGADGDDAVVSVEEDGRAKSEERLLLGGVSLREVVAGVGSVVAFPVVVGEEGGGSRVDTSVDMMRVYKRIDYDGFGR